MKASNIFKSKQFFCNLKEKYYIVPLGLIFCMMLSGCHSSKYYMSRYIDIKTSPNATVFWENGQKITTADADGKAKISLSEYRYRKGCKKITVAKAGYEPQTVNLHKKFNGRVMYNLFFPPAFLWGHYTTVNFKKTNYVSLSVNSRKDAMAYLSLADDASSLKKKTRLLKNAIYQDPDNKDGLAVVCTNKLSDLYYETKDYDDSQFWALCGSSIDPSDEMSRYNYQRAVNAVVEKAERRRRRAEKWNTGLSLVAQGLGAASTFMSGGNSVSTTTTNYTGGTTSSNSKSRNNQASYDVWARQAERLYKQLTDKNGYTGNSKTRSVDVQAFHKAQREMRNIRIKAAQDGNPVQKSEYESKVIN